MFLEDMEYKNKSIPQTILGYGPQGFISWIYMIILTQQPKLLKKLIIMESVQSI